MSAVTIQQMADRVAVLMEERLRIRGKGLADKTRRAGRSLPRRVRVAAEHLVAAQAMSQSPKLRMQIDEAQVAQSYDICLRHLGGINATARAWATILNRLASIAFILLVVATLIAVVVYLRGLA